MNADSLGFHGAPQAFNEGHSDYRGASRYDDPEVYLVSESVALYNPRDLLRCHIPLDLVPEPGDGASPRTEVPVEAQCRVPSV